MESSYYDSLCNMIIRPRRDSYSPECLGPRYILLQRAEDFKVVHSSIRLKNSRGLTLQCSFYEPFKSTQKASPCIVFLHGNSSSRVEALPLLDFILPQNFSLFCFDFSGSGKSEGEYVTLGYFERLDVKCVVDYLRKCGRVSGISLWGRSMGAVTALLYASIDPTIDAIVADSPFRNLEELAKDLMDGYFKIPKPIFSLGFSLFKLSVEEKAKMRIDELNVSNHLARVSRVPIMFVYGKEDDFIKPKHCLKLYEDYNGPKVLCPVEGNHHTPRSPLTIMKVLNFFVHQMTSQDGKILNASAFPTLQNRKTHSMACVSSSKEFVDHQRLSGFFSHSVIKGSSESSDPKHLEKVYFNSKAETHVKEPAAP